MKYMGNNMLIVANPKGFISLGHSNNAPWAGWLIRNRNLFLKFLLSLK